MLSRIGAILLFLSAWPCSLAAWHLKVWPLIDYRREAALTSLELLGPLLEVRADGAERMIAVRPLFSWTRSRTDENRLAVLYPLATSSWDAEATSVRLLGLFSFQSRSVPAQTERERRITLFPFVFYRDSAVEGTSLSVLPIYGTLENFLGYDRVRWILFPLHLQLREGLTETNWAPFPFVAWSGGEVGRGWRVWPLFGWHSAGDRQRFWYVLWPLYIHQELHRTADAREVRRVITPFYWTIDSPVQRSRSYGFLFTHSIDQEQDTETWGFPWPLWVYQKRLKTDEVLTLRLAPFYQDRRQGPLRSRFYLWPLYRAREYESEDFLWSRRDFLLLLGRSVDERNLTYGHYRSLGTFFPLWRRMEEDRETRFSTLAVLDALFPRNQEIQTSYAPLWQVYTGREVEGGPLRWSLLWDLISSDGERMLYPLHFDFPGDEHAR